MEPDTKKITQELQTFILALKDREDLFVYNATLNPPASPEVIESYRDKLPASLLDFYSVMNGCSFKATFKAEENISLGIRVPKIENTYSYLSNDSDYRFPEDYQFMEIENSDPTGASYLLLEPGEHPTEAIVVTAWAAKEDRYKVTGKTFGEFLQNAIKNNLVICWFSDDDGIVEHKKIAKKILSKNPKKVILPVPGDRGEHSWLGPGTILRYFESERKNKSYGNQFVLVELDTFGHRVWIQSHKFKKLPKKKDFYEKIHDDLADFIKYMINASPEESAMLISNIGSYDMYGKVSYNLPKLSYSFNHIFSCLPLPERLETMLTLLEKWVANAKQIGFLKRHKFTGDIKYKAAPWDNEWIYYEIIYSTLGSLLLSILDHQNSYPEYTLDKGIHKRLQNLNISMENISTEKDYDYFWQDVKNFENFLTRLPSDQPLADTKPIEKTGSKLNKELIELGLDPEFNYIYG